MNLTILKGSYSKEELLEIITQMIHIKIRFHENKISSEDGEEQIKMREKRIIELQKNLYTLKRNLDQANSDTIHVDSEINISAPILTDHTLLQTV